MGEKINALKNPMSEYLKAVEFVGSSLIDRTWKPWLHPDFVYYGMTEAGKETASGLKILHDFTDSVIKSRKKDIMEKISNSGHLEEMDNPTSTKKKEPFMDSLILEHLKNPSYITETDIREEVDTFMFEGHDTTAWGVIWAVYLIGLDRRVQSKLQEEIDHVFESPEHGAQLTMDDLSRLKYTEACIKEAQRLYPSVPVIGRLVEEDIRVKVSGQPEVVVPAGCQVFVAPRSIHQDPKHWGGGAIRFKPERFLAEDNIDVNMNQYNNMSNGEETGKRHPYSYIPFSAGARNCIGQRFAILEEKAIIATIFRYFNVQSLDHRDKIIAAATPITKTLDPIRIRIEERLIDK